MKFTSDFWKFWTGQTVSTLGGSFTSFALPLVIYKLAGSALNLAFTVVVSVLPYLLLGLVIGAWADRVNRKRLMIFTDIARALVIASLPLLFALGFLSVWWIYAVSFISSTLSICFDAANFAAIPGLVEVNDLMTANGRLQAGYSTATIIGPVLAGLLLLVVPLPLLLLVDAASFLISAGSLAMIKASFNNVSDEKKEASSLHQDIGEGLRYVLYAESALEFLERWAAGHALDTSAHPMHIRQAAVHLNVSVDMLRNWERNGLLTVPRDPTNHYRLYGSAEFGRLRVIRTLVKCGFSLMAILRMLQQFDNGNTTNLREALSVPPEEDADKSIFAIADHWLAGLQEQEQRAQQIIEQIGRMINMAYAR